MPLAGKKMEHARHLDPRLLPFLGPSVASKSSAPALPHPLYRRDGARPRLLHSCLFQSSAPPPLRPPPLRREVANWCWRCKQRPVGASSGTSARLLMTLSAAGAWATRRRWCWHPVHLLPSHRLCLSPCSISASTSCSRSLKHSCLSKNVLLALR